MWYRVVNEGRGAVLGSFPSPSADLVATRTPYPNPLLFRLFFVLLYDLFRAPPVPFPPDPGISYSQGLRRRKVDLAHLCLRLGLGVRTS